MKKIVKSMSVILTIFLFVLTVIFIISLDLKIRMLHLYFFRKGTKNL